MTEAQTWIYMLQKTREQTLGYLTKLSEENLHQPFQLEGCRINSIFWISAHLAVSANFLLLHTTGAERVKLPWARAYGLGGNGLPENEAPPIAEVLEALNEIQKRAESFIGPMTDTDFAKPTVTGTNFGGEDSLRSIISHHIRHENAHAGQLGLICKALGKPTI
jgi:uncharacterized damage-inducible protein DinB